VIIIEIYYFSSNFTIGKLDLSLTGHSSFIKENDKA